MIQRIRSFKLFSFRPSIFRFCLVLLSLFLFLTKTETLFAASVNISASIPDHIAPSTPILISPADEALLSTATPDFQWHESIDETALAGYRIFLDSVQHYGDLPLTDTDNSNYVLTYDSLNGIYSLIPKTALSEGYHSWRIEAFDYGDNSGVSDTWNFTVDTLVPDFIITQIGDQGTNISALNPSSVPSSPVILFANDPTANEPIIVASTEANSSVSLLVSIPGDPSQSFSTSVDGSGHYQLQLGILPRDTDIRLDFTITDQVGHVSVLEGLYIRIPTYYWPASPTPTYTPTPAPTATATPTPQLTPVPTRRITPAAVLSPSPVVSPSPTLLPSVSPLPTALPTKSIQIPIIPPKEVVHEFTQEVSERFPEKIAKALDAMTRSAWWLALAPWLAVLLSVLPILFAFLLVLSKFFSLLSPQLFKKLFQLFWLQIFQQNAGRHLVFEESQSIAAPLVRVELRDAQSKELLEYQITDANGNFQDFAWPSGKTLQLQVVDKNFYFPVGIKKPVQLQLWEYYQNEAFQVNEHWPPAFLIPTLVAQGQQRLPFFERWRIFSFRLLAYPLVFCLPMWFLSLMIALRYPSWPNSLAVLFYLLILGLRFWKRSKQRELQFFADSQAGRYTGRLLYRISQLQTGWDQAGLLNFTQGLSQKIRVNGAADHFLAFGQQRIIRVQDHALATFRFLMPAEVASAKTEASRIQLHTEKIADYRNQFQQLFPLCLLTSPEEFQQKQGKL